MSGQSPGRKTTRMLKPQKGVNILSEFSRMADRMDKRSLTDLLLDTVSGEFGLSQAQIFLQAGGKMQLAAWRGPKSEVGEIKIGSTTRRFLAERRAPVTFSELQGERKLGDLAGAFGEYRPSLLFPIVHGEALVGLCVVGKPGERGPLAVAEREMLSALVNHAGLAIGASDTEKKAREVTRMLKKVKQEKEVFDKHKDNFVRITCHELNTPLNIISLNASLLLQGEGGELSPEQKELVENIRQNIARLAEVNNDLVHLARRATASDYEAEWCSFDDIFTRVMERSSMLFAERADIEVNVSIDDNLPRLFVCSHDVVRALTNVIQNSVKFTPDNNGRIDISAKFADGSITCIVKDNGIGIDKKYHEIVFEPFVELIDYRKRSSSASRFLGAGLGLGLTIARDIIESNGGTITLESEGENKGTTVYVKLPAGQEEA